MPEERVEQLKNSKEPWICDFCENNNNVYFINKLIYYRPMHLPTNKIARRAWAMAVCPTSDSKRSLKTSSLILMEDMEVVLLNENAIRTQRV